MTDNFVPQWSPPPDGGSTPGGAFTLGTPIPPQWGPSLGGGSTLVIPALILDITQPQWMGCPAAGRLKRSNGHLDGSDELRAEMEPAANGRETGHQGVA